MGSTIEDVYPSGYTVILYGNTTYTLNFKCFMGVPNPSDNMVPATNGAAGTESQTNDPSSSVPQFATIEITGDKFKINEISREGLVSLQDAKVLGLLFLRERLNSQEMEAVKKFVMDGGGLLVTGEWGNVEQNTDILNEFTSQFYVTFNKDRIIDPVHSYYEKMDKTDGSGLQKKVREFIKITNFAEHPITNGIKEVAYFAGCSLNAPRDKQLAWSNLMSFSDLDMDGNWSVNEKMGRLPIASYHEFGKGRVVFLGDTTILTDEYLAYADNNAFCFQIMKWLEG